MSNQSSIEWTDVTWNSVTGCSKVSPGCKNCYAERLALRLKAMGNPRYKNEFEVTLHSDQLTLPLRWRRPKKIFVNSMSDLFHEKVPDEFIFQMFEVMKKADWHLFQILTKRADRLEEMAPYLPWPKNVWQGVSVENAEYIERVDSLIKVPSAIRFISVEPLLGPIPKLPLKDISWVIVGGESGPGARPMHEDWVISIRDQCRKHNVPFFFKQWGGVRKHKTGRMLDGRTYDEIPH